MNHQTKLYFTNQNQKWSTNINFKIMKTYFGTNIYFVSTSNNLVRQKNITCMKSSAVGPPDQGGCNAPSMKWLYYRIPIKFGIFFKVGFYTN